jgi:KipI family sensor histidine kinase inhibitor
VIRPAGDSTVVVELEEQIDPAVNRRAIALAESIRGAAISGVRDVVPTYCTVAVFFDPLRVDYDALVATIERKCALGVSNSEPTHPPVRVPVCYGGEFGPDLGDVARFAGLSEREVVELHTSTRVRVFMLGFVPGFPYMGEVDRRIAMPRLDTPRVRVPAGSVGIAGAQTGIYPTDTAGGWRVIGRTSLNPFDLARPEPCLFKAGQTVEFQAIDRAEFERVETSSPAGIRAEKELYPFSSALVEGSSPIVVRPDVRARSLPGPGALRVISSGMLTTVQDLGRWGFQAWGVPVAGPMDPWSHRLANALAGNESGDATLEVTLLGPELEFNDERVVAIAGAEFDLTLNGRRVSSNQALLAQPGSRLRFGIRRRGARAYVAVSGGIDVAPVLGSRSTHVPSGMGGLNGRPLKDGDELPLGNARAQPARLYHSVTPRTLPRGGPARVRIIPGPQAARFEPNAISALQAGPYGISPRSDRMGFRLEGPRLVHAGGADVISDATPLGSLQVPSSGQPILLMADCQTTGGYPKIATAISADLGIAGQLAPGDTVSFAVCCQRDALSALIEAERQLMALGPLS